MSVRVGILAAVSIATPFGHRHVPAVRFWLKYFVVWRRRWRGSDRLRDWRLNGVIRGKWRRTLRRRGSLRARLLRWPLSRRGRRHRQQLQFHGHDLGGPNLQIVPLECPKSILLDGQFVSSRRHILQPKNTVARALRFQRFSVCQQSQRDFRSAHRLPRRIPHNSLHRGELLARPRQSLILLPVLLESRESFAPRIIPSRSRTQKCRQHRQQRHTTAASAQRYRRNQFLEKSARPHRGFRSHRMRS